MLASYGNIATEDLNGDGVMDLSDSFTYGSVDYRDTPEKFIFASGMNMVDVGEDDLPYITFYGNENSSTPSSGRGRSSSGTTTACSLRTWDAPTCS